MKLLSLLGLLLLGLAVGGVACKKTFSLVSFNDVYNMHPSHEHGGGYLNGKSHQFVERNTILGGLHNTADVIAQQLERVQSAGHVGSLLTLNGDFLGPSVVSSVFTVGKHMIDIMNAMGIELVVYGNHEFDTGAALAIRMMQQSNFLWLGANTRDATDVEDGPVDHNTLPLMGSDVPYVGRVKGLPRDDFPFSPVSKHAGELPINERLVGKSMKNRGYNREVWESVYDGIRVCSFGVVTKGATVAPANNKTTAIPIEAPGHKLHPSNITSDLEKNRDMDDPDTWHGTTKKLYLQDPVKRAIEVIRQLRNREEDVCNIIVALTHVDMKEDEAIAKFNCKGCRVERGADVVLGGHEHMPIVGEPSYTGGALIWKSGSDGHFVGVIDIHIGDDGMVEGTDHKMIPVYPNSTRWEGNLETLHASNEPWAETPKYIKNIVDAYSALTKPFEDRKLGKWIGEYDTATVRLQETAAGHYLAQAMHSLTGTEIAVIQTGTIRDARYLDDGIEDFTYMDIMAQLPFIDKVVTMELREADVYRVVSHMVKQRGTGLFPAVSGLRVEFSNDGTVHKMSYETGEELDPNNRERVVTMSCTGYLPTEMSAVFTQEVHVISEKPFLSPKCGCDTDSCVCTHPAAAELYWKTVLKGQFDATNWKREHIVCRDCPPINPPDD